MELSTRRYFRSARPDVIRIAGVFALVAAAVVGVATPAQAHPWGDPQLVEIGREGDDTVVVTWRAGMADDISALAGWLGVLPAERSFVYQDGAWLIAESDPTDVQFLADAPMFPDYLLDNITVATPAGACSGTVGDTSLVGTTGVPIVFDCPSEADEVSIGITMLHDLSSDYKTLVTYGDMVVLYDQDHTIQDWTLPLEPPGPSVETWGERLATFFVLGAEHLLFGPDHLLFLAALIVGSRRLQEIVLTATVFTVAHSVTLILASLGAIHVPPAIVEPLIAASIAVVAGWQLYRLLTKQESAIEIDTVSDSKWALDRSGWVRLAIVFGFGLIHGLGFAGSLGLDEGFSWPLLADLLVFNVGIEAVQVAIIIALFPLLMLVRRRSRTAYVVVTATVAGVVTVMALWWFLERIGLLPWAPLSG